jgi:2-iminobutanoate/2-iminopropanoate deaminase
MQGKQVIKTKEAPEAIGPYSVGISAGGFVFTAGQIGIEPSTGEVVSGGVEAETRQALANLSKVLQSGGSSIDQVVKTTVFLRDIQDFTKMNEVYAEFFKENHPARSAVQVAALPKGVAVEIEAIALISE